MSKRWMKQSYHCPFNPRTYLTPVAYCPVWWTQNISVAGNQCFGLQQVLAVCSRESLFIRAHGLDAQHRSLFFSVGPTCRWTRFPLPCPPPAGRHRSVRRSAPGRVHSLIPSLLEKVGKCTLQSWEALGDGADSVGIFCRQGQCDLFNYKPQSPAETLAHMVAKTKRNKQDGSVV